MTEPVDQNPDAPESASDEVSVESVGNASSAEQAPSADHAKHTKTRKPWWLWLIVTVVVIAVVVVGVVIWQSNNEEPQEPVTPPAVTVTNPVPTPAITPVKKESGSDFYDLLPTTVLQYALVESEPNDAKAVRTALESVSLTYSDGDDGEIVVTGTQWETKKEAKKYAKKLDAKAADAHPDAPLTEGSVDVDEDELGTMKRRLGESEGQVTWTNGTSVLTAVGPVAGLEDFYTAFPL